MNASFWRERRVFLTGITGFKGAWLALWLRDMGADVCGYSLAPPTTPSLFEVLRLDGGASWVERDVRERATLRKAMTDHRSDVVFHLAAQSLVRASYEQPISTFETNVLGSVNVLDVARECPSVKAIVVVTSDKCYDNREWAWPYRETDPLGGHDPYSSSKACAEIVTAAYRRSFLADRGIGVATVRAGNVVGGGDWARDRIVPDLVSAIVARRTGQVRNPRSIRPWQHVLEPLAGYLVLAERLFAEPQSYGESWNFGPAEASVRTVGELATTLCDLWGDGSCWEQVLGTQAHEARLLTLDSSKARARLDWRPRLTFEKTVEWTVAWYKAFARGADPTAGTLSQIRQFQEACP